MSYKIANLSPNQIQGAWVIIFFDLQFISRKSLPIKYKFEVFQKHLRKREMFKICDRSDIFLIEYYIWREKYRSVPWIKNASVAKSKITAYN